MTAVDRFSDACWSRLDGWYVVYNFRSRFQCYLPQPRHHKMRPSPASGNGRSGILLLPLLSGLQKLPGVHLLGFGIVNFAAHVHQLNLGLLLLNSAPGISELRFLLDPLSSIW